MLFESRNARAFGIKYPTGHHKSKVRNRNFSKNIVTSRYTVLQNVCSNVFVILLTKRVVPQGSRLVSVLEYGYRFSIPGNSTHDYLCCSAKNFGFRALYCNSTKAHIRGILNAGTAGIPEE
jgi:hypothetical protein